MTRRTRLTLADRAQDLPTIGPKTAGCGAPCEHPAGCKRPWTTWTVRGGRCDWHPLTPAETPTISDTDRQPSMRSGGSTTLARSKLDPKGAP